MAEENITAVITIQEPIIQLTENGVEGFEILCRICANRNDHLIPIYSEEGVSNDLADKMNLYLPIKVSKSDTLPLQCCFQCASTVLTWHELVIASVEADRRLKEVQTEVEKQISEQNLQNDEPGPSLIENDDDGFNPATDNKSDIIEEYEILNVEYCSDEDDLICKYCSKSYDKKSDILKHIKYCNLKELNKTKRVRRKKNEIIAQYFCDICSKGFTRKYDMLKHQTTQHKNITVKESNLKQKNLELLEKSKIKTPDGKEYYKCEVCNKTISFSYNFIRHQTIHTGSKPFFCHICGKSYRMSSTLNRHIRELHYRIKKFSCDVCEQKFAAKSSLDDHKNIHDNIRPFVCDICGKNFKQKASLHVHKLFHTNIFRFSCNVCGKKYRRARELKVHSWVHTGHRPYSCKICGNMFRLSQDLKRHSKIHKKPDSEFVCVECGAIFAQEQSLKNHKKIHSIKTETS